MPRVDDGPALEMAVLERVAKLKEHLSRAEAVHRGTVMEYGSESSAAFYARGWCDATRAVLTFLITGTVAGGAAAPKADKVAHVRRARQDRDHKCHWPGCGRQVPPALWGCRRHWMMLPKRLRDRVWAAYRPGQEADGRPSADYLDVARDVQAWIKENHGAES